MASATSSSPCCISWVTPFWWGSYPCFTTLIYVFLAALALSASLEVVQLLVPERELRAQILP